MAGLPPAARLRRPGDFAALRHARGRINTQCFTLRWMPGAEGARLGLAVSRKVSKRAVVRNRIKRVVRESFRVQRIGLPDVDVLVVARPPAATRDSRDLHAELDQAWRTLRSQSLKRASAPGTIGG